MKRTFLSKLHTNGVYYIIGALLLLLVVPLYQVLVLVSQGYNDALAAATSNYFGPYLAWIGSHSIQFVGYRLLFVIAFALLFTLPFTLFRIIVAQEVLGGEEEEEDAGDEQEGEEDKEVQQEEVGDVFADAWRGKGYAVIAAWSGFFGVILYVLGTLAGTIYLVASASTYTSQTPLLAITTPKNRHANASNPPPTVLVVIANALASQATLLAIGV
jgi:hypothetical protein